jgi:hypothetical protein
MPELNFLHVRTPHMGYGRMGSYIASEMRKRGITVYDDMPGLSAIDRVEGNARVFLQGSETGRSNVVCWAAAPSHAAGWWKGQMPCLLTMYETQYLAEGFRAALPNFETVIVPSVQNQELFSEYHPNVHYVPLGVDPQTWKYVPRQTPDRYFRFLIGGRGARKGTDLAVKAFNTLWGKDGSWGSGPEPRLLMKNPVAEDYYRGDGRIEMISGRISQEEEVALYASAHCYLGPSRGEGFGLQPLQAIAQGCPTILTDAHGHKAFSRLGWGLSTTDAQSEYFIYGDSGLWWEPNLDELIEHMRAVYNNYDMAAAAAEFASSVALEEFTWERTTTKFLDAIGRENLTGYDGPEEWISPDTLKYPVVLNRDWSCEIGGYAYAFKKGERYFQLADVKRVLYEADLLDPACLGGEDANGLLTSQIEEQGRLVAGRELCPTCGGEMP